MTETKAPLVERYFTAKNEGKHPFECVEWVKRDAQITDSKGQIFFEQKDMEFPASWSQQAVNIVASKYFKGPLGSDKREHSVRQLITRVVEEIAKAGVNGSYLDVVSGEARIFTEELTHLLVNQMAAFNSPVWFNVGVKDERSSGWCWYGRNIGPSQELGTVIGQRLVRDDEHKPQTSACFIVAPEDNMESILDWVKTEGLIFKGGSGSGANVSKLRSSKEFLTSGGRPSGPLPFMQINDTAAGSIRSGGKHRRAAKMVELDSAHPDIFEFVRSKAAEERKIRKLIEAGWKNDNNDPNGAQAACAFQNENHSVSVDDLFMIAADRGMEYSTFAVVSGQVVETFKASTLLHEIAEATWVCGDPGMQFRNTMNKWNVVAGTAEIRGTNPCGEFVFIDDSSCNLASLNLMKFRDENGNFEEADFVHAVNLMILAQDILVDMSSYPTAAICRNSHNLRPLGLGYANLGAFLMAKGLPYDSDKARIEAERITAIMTGQAYLTSGMIAEHVGPFPLWKNNQDSALAVLKKHFDYAESRTPGTAGYKFARAITKAQATGLRNAQVTLLAPTGTIGFMMDCDTTGIEPEFNLVKYKNLVGGGTMKIVNQTVLEALKALHWGNPELAKAYIEKHGYLEGYPDVTDKYLAVFDTAAPAGPSKRSIHYTGHIKMMAAVQPFLSGAISKTVNMPETATVEDIEKAYMMAWKMGLKAIAIYRDNSKNIQPLVTKKDGEGSGKDPASIDYDSFDVTLSAIMKADQGRAWLKARGFREDVFDAGGLVDADLPLEGKLKTLMTTGDGRKWLEEHGLVEKASVSISSRPVLNRQKMPTTRNAICHKFDIAGHQGYLHIGLYEDGRPGEIFITMNKEGSTLAGLMGNFSLMTSLALQYGVPLPKLVEKFSHVKYDPAGITKDPDIRFADSVVDYIFRWMEKEFIKPKLPLEDRTNFAGLNVQVEGARASNAALQAAAADLDRAKLVNSKGDLTYDQVHDEILVEVHTYPKTGIGAALMHKPLSDKSADAPFCGECGSLMVRNGSCFKCANCGGTSGCS